MLIVADQNIPFAEEAFRQFGEVRLVPGRDLKAGDLAEADALIVRSVTRVDRALLEGTPVGFVGTATIGTDHLDIPALDQLGIPWRSAAGCNARSVVEYVLAALAEFCLASGGDWAGKTLGIVGCGNIGQPLADVAERLGISVLRNDPPREERGDSGPWTPLRDLLRRSDFVTLHTPLTREGPHCTLHLIGEAELALLRPGALLINAGRGPVLDNHAALIRRGLNLVLDVFENEPSPDRELTRRCFLSTPHIAGYSFDGKVNGTRMMAQALGQWLDKPSTWTPFLEPPPAQCFELQETELMQATAQAIRHSYDIRQDSGQLREGLNFPGNRWGWWFDKQRKDYPRRREFANYHVKGVAPGASLWRRLSLLGFHVN